MRKILIITLVLIIKSVSLVSNDQNIVEIAMPKSGTNLLKKAISLITKKTHVSVAPGTALPQGYYSISLSAFEYLTHLPSNKFWLTHLMYTPYFAQKLYNQKCVVFFMYRDPRDQLMSFIFYMYKHSNRWPKVLTMSFDELIFDLIHKSTVANNHPPAHGILDLYEKYLPWINTAGVYSIRFEDLIGPHGGGSLETQHHIIKNIAQHVGYTLTGEEITTIANQLFGNTHTFREGKIGSWKKYFNADHKKAFKEVAGQLLINLGYEKDMNW